MPLSYFYDSAQGAVFVRQGSSNLAKISQGAAGAYSMQDLVATGTVATSGTSSFVYENFGTDTVSNVENFLFDYADNTSGTTLTITSADLASAFSGSIPPTTYNDIQVSNHYLEQVSGKSSLVKVVPTSVSASGLTLAVQLDSAIRDFDGVNLNFKFNTNLLKENLAASKLNGTWDLSVSGLPEGDPSTLVMVAIDLTPVTAASLPVLASLAFTWAPGVTGPVTTSGLRLDLSLENDTTKTKVLDALQELVFRPAILGGTATGTAGNDQFIIGGGDVVVTGGLGNDRFVPTSGMVNLTIADFTSGTDKIDLGRLISSSGYNSHNTDPLASVQAGVLGNWGGQTLPTSTQIVNRDPLLDNKGWLSYNSQTKRLDLYSDLLPSPNQVDIGQMSIQFGSASTGFGLSDLDWAPYSVQGTVIG